MKAIQIKVLGLYTAKVTNKIVTVRVDAIREIPGTKTTRSHTIYGCTNLTSGRRVTFKSAAKFRSIISEGKTIVERKDGRELHHLQVPQLEETAKRIEKEKELPRAELLAKAVKLKSKLKDSLVGVFKAGTPEADRNFAARFPELAAKADAERQNVEGKESHPKMESTSVAGAEVMQEPGTILTIDAQGNAGTLTMDSANKEGEQRLPKPISLLVASIVAQRPAVTTSAATTVPKNSTIVNGLAASIAAAQVQETQRFHTTTAPHIIVEALAGTGKTTTLIEGLKKLFRLETGITPSPQQQAVWTAMLQGPVPRFACFCAFNNSIAAELGSRIPQGRGCKAGTLHALGNFACYKAFSLIRKDVEPEERLPDIIEEMLQVPLRTLRKERGVLYEAIKSLVVYCKQNLTLTWEEIANSAIEDVVYSQQLNELCERYSIEITPTIKEEVYTWVPKILNRCLDANKDGYVDYDDMVWLPVILKLPVFKNDLLLVDEYQDLNRCQQELAKMGGRRLVFVGDRHQAIYGFAGADADGVNRIARDLQSNCVILPLTVTRRCGKAIVREAQAYVPEFEAHFSNPEGRVSHEKYPIQTAYDSYGRKTVTELPIEKTYIPHVDEGDMVLCRANAPLVKECFRFLKMGKRAGIQGRKIGDQLMNTIKRVDAHSIEELMTGLRQLQSKEINTEMGKKVPSESRMDIINDKYSCLYLFAEMAGTVDGVLAKIGMMFTDNPHAPGVRLSSIHKAKGLEASQVFYLRGFGPPHDRLKAWEVEQEHNLAYVAITRAIDSLVYVD